MGSQWCHCQVFWWTKGWMVVRKTGGGPGGVVSRWGGYILPFWGAKGRDMLILLFKVGINICFLCLHLCFIVFCSTNSVISATFWYGTLLTVMYWLSCIIQFVLVHNLFLCREKHRSIKFPWNGSTTGLEGLSLVSFVFEWVLWFREQVQWPCYINACGSTRCVSVGRLIKLLQYCKCDEKVKFQLLMNLCTDA